jgi:hypothetical protein
MSCSIVESGCIEVRLAAAVRPSFLFKLNHVPIISMKSICFPYLSANVGMIELDDCSDPATTMI